MAKSKSNGKENGKMKRKLYDKELRKLQVELCHLQPFGFHPFLQHAQLALQPQQLLLVLLPLHLLDHRLLPAAARRRHGCQPPPSAR